MIRKILAVACCVSLLLTAPGVNYLFAASNPVEYTYSYGRWVGFQQLDQQIPTSLQDLERGIQRLDVSELMKAQAHEVIEHVSPYLKNTNQQPQEVKGAIERFNTLSNQSNANSSMLLMELFDNLEHYAHRMEAASNVQDVIKNTEDLQIIRTVNAEQHRMIEEEWIKKISATVKKAEIYKPDPKHPGEKILDAVVYLITRNGHTEQKIVWSRHLLTFADILKRVFYERQDVERELKDNKKDHHLDSKPGKQEELENSLKYMREKYKDAGIDAIIEGLDGAGSEEFKSGLDMPIQKIEARARVIEGWQVTLQRFYSNIQLDESQKGMLAEMISYFARGVGLQYNPLDEKGVGASLERMDTDDIQRHLEDFERGSYSFGGNGLIGDGLASMGVKLSWRTQKLETGMPPALCRIVSQAVQFLGYSAAAKKRSNAARHNEENSSTPRMKERYIQEQLAALEEQGDWMKLAQQQLQAFELYQSAQEVEDFRDGKNMEMRLRDEDKDAANRLIDAVRGKETTATHEDFLSKFKDLENRSEKNLLQRTAVSFDETFKNARYGDLVLEDLQTAAAVLVAKANLMKAIFLSMHYGTFAENPDNLAAYRKMQKDGSQYYRDQAEGGLYEYYLDHLDSKTADEKKIFDSVISQLESLSHTDLLQAREQLAKLQEQLGDFFAMLSVDDMMEKGRMPQAEKVEEQSQRLSVFQNWLDASIRQFNLNLGLFTSFNELDLTIEKYTVSKDASETRGNSKINYVMNFDWMNRLGNTLTGGLYGRARDAAGDLSARVLSPESYQMLGTPEAKQLRDEIRQKMRDNKYIEAEALVAQIDQKTADKSRERYDLSQTKDLEDQSFGVVNILSRSTSGPEDQIVNDVLQSVNDHFSHYMKGHMVGSGLFDLAVSIVANPIAAMVISSISSRVGMGFIKGARMIRSLAKANQALKRAEILASSLMVTARFLEKVGRFFVKVGTGVSKALQLTESAKVGNRVGKVGTILKASAKFTGHSMLGAAGMGTLTNAAMYKLYQKGWIKTSPYHSWGEALGEGALMNAAWAARASLAFTLTMPSSAVQGKNFLFRAYRWFGARVGVGDMLADGIARALLLADRMGVQLMGRNVAKAIVKNENGVYGILGEKIQAVGKSGGFFSAGVGRNLMAKPLLGTVQFLDNVVRFTLVTSLAQEVYEAGNYYWRIWQGPEGPQDELSLPSQLQAVAGAHRGAEGATQLVFALLPGGHYASEEEMTRSREAMWARASFIDRLNRGDRTVFKEINKIADEPITNSVKVEVPVDWRQSGLLRGAVRRILGKKTVEVTITSEFHKALQEANLRYGLDNHLIGVEHLVAITALPEKEWRIYEKRDEKQKGREEANDQMFMTPDQVLEAQKNGGTIVNNVDIAQDRVDRRNAKDPNSQATYEAPSDYAIYVSPETRAAALEILGEELVKSKNIGLLTAISKADITQTIKNANGKEELASPVKIGNIEITNRDTVKKLQEGVDAIKYNDVKDRIPQVLTKRFRKKQGAIYSREMEAIADQTQAIWTGADQAIERVRADNTMNAADQMIKIQEIKIERASQLEKIFGNAEKKIPASPTWQALYDNLDRLAGVTWDQTVEKISGGDENQTRALQRLRDKVKAEMVLRFNADYLSRQVGKVQGAERDRVVQRFVNTIEAVLGTGNIVNRENRKMEQLRPAQRQALTAWAKAVVDGDTKKATKIFLFLEASGGKTLLAYVAFVPYALVRAEKSDRKLWFTTSNELLAEQFKADWAAFSGGRAPDFKVTSLDEAKFEAVFRRASGERSLGTDYHFAMDEADENFRKPSNSIGEPNGEVSEGNPALGVRELGLETIIALDDVERDRMTKDKDYRKEKIAQIVKELLVPKWHEGMKAALRSGNEQFRIEAAHLRDIVQEDYGRFSPENPDYKPVASDSRDWLDWLTDDGVEKFLRQELHQHFETLSMADKSEILKIEIQKGKVTPVNFASAMPTLATGHRVTGQLMAIWLRTKIMELRANGPLSPAEARRVTDEFFVAKNAPAATRKEFIKLLTRRLPPPGVADIAWGPARVDNPLKTKKIDTEDGQVMTLKEFFQDISEAGADITLFSGTAGNRVQSYLESEGVVFANQEGATKMPERSFMIVDKVGKVQWVDSIGTVIHDATGKDQTWHSDGGLDKFNLRAPRGVGQMRKAQLMLHLSDIKLKQGEQDKKKSMVILAPRTMDEYLLLRDAIEDPEIRKILGVEEHEIVAFRPDFVQEAREEKNSQEMSDENNVKAVENGTAKIVLLVPEIAGRGVDLAFKKGGYKKILMVGENVHEVPVVEDKQAKARPGPGRVGDADVEFIDVASKDDLVSSEKYLPEAKEIVRLAVELAMHKQPTQPDQAIQEIKDARLKAAQELAKIVVKESGNSPDAELLWKDKDTLQEFVTRPEVYKVIVGDIKVNGKPVEGAGLQEIAQLEANRTSGILTPTKEVALTDIAKEGFGITFDAFKAGGFALATVIYPADLARRAVNWTSNFINRSPQTPLPAASPVSQRAAGGPLVNQSHPMVSVGAP